MADNLEILLFKIKFEKFQLNFNQAKYLGQTL